MTLVLRCTTVALVLLSLFACSKSPGGPGGKELEAATIKKRDPTRVRVEPAERREMLRVLETTTRVESEHEVEVMPRSSGVVVEVLVEEGQTVEEGQVLARLDARELVIAVSVAEVALLDARASEPRLALAVREAEAKLATANRSYDQSLRDYTRNEAIAQAGPDRPALLSPKDLDASRLARDIALANVQSAEIVLERARLEVADIKTSAQRAQLTLERARLDLANLSLTAPFRGVLASRGIKVGDTVSTSTGAFTLTDPENLRAIFYRPQRELGLFTRGRMSSDAPANGGALPSHAEVELFATAEALPGKRFLGRIERIAPTIDPQSGNFRVTARLDGTAEGDPSVRLLPGMLVRLEIITERRPHALVVPKRALRREGDENLVFVVRGERVARLAVTEGLSEDEHLEIVLIGDGRLEPGEQVVVVGNRDLEDGSEVVIATGDEAQERPRAAAAEATPASTDAPSDTEEARAPKDETPAPGTEAKEEPKNPPAPPESGDGR